jgi:hypothetical protein
VIDRRIKAALTTQFPPPVVNELLECYVEQKKNFYLGRLRPNEVEGGRFAEAAFRLLQHAAGMTVAPLGARLDTERLIIALANVSAGTVPDSVRLHIPRTLRVVYDIRNTRDAAHLGDGIDPNLQDSSLVSAALDWVLAEFIRFAGGLSPAEAYELVRGITVRRVPAVEQFGDFLKTLRPSLGPSERILLLLYHCADMGATATELAGWLKPKQRTNLPRTLSQLEHDKDCIVFAAGKYRLTRRGVSVIESRRLVEIE